MPDRQREIYHSENGDRWFLSRDDDSHAFIQHKANLSSGGKVSVIELSDFLSGGKAWPRASSPNSPYRESRRKRLM